MTHAERVGDGRGRLAVIAMALAVLLAGSAAGVTAASGPGAGDGATISPEVSAGEGEQVVLVYFGTDMPGVAQDAGGVTVDQLKDRSSSAQAPLDRYAESTAGVTVLNSFWLGNVAVVGIDHDRADVADLAAIDGVEHVGPNFAVTVEAGAAAGLVHPTIEPDAGYTSPDGVTLQAGTMSSHTTYGLEQINAPDVWSAYSTKGSGTTVAVLDSGVDPNHPDIDLDKWQEWDGNGNKEDTNPQDYDPNGHGTHVSGTVAGGDAGGTAIGVAPDVTLHHGAVLTECNTNGCIGTGRQIVAGMQWAVDNNADVLSMSFGGEGYLPGYIDLVRDAQSAGTLVVAASGNTGVGTSASPGNVYDALSVGASDQQRNVAGFSSGEQIDTDRAWGSAAPSDWPAQYTVPTVSAPGVQVRSSLPGGGYGDKAGTSMATPHVAGAAALVQAATSADLAPAEIETALITTANHPDGDIQDTRYGYGIIDVKAAADYASGGLPADFEVRIDATTSPISEGETLTVDATVHNTGGTSATQTITLDVPGLGQDSTSATLSAGESTTVSLSVGSSSGDAGSYTATVQSSDDSDSTGVEVQAPANFAVTIDSTNSPVFEGESLTVDATVENTGGAGDTQSVSLAVGGRQRNATEVTLAAGESQSLTLSWATGEDDAGDYTATVESDDVRDSAAVTVQEPAEFAVEITDTNAPILQNGTLRVNATVENAGGVSARQSITLTVGGQQRDATDVTLAPGENQSLALTWATSEDDAGEYDAVVASADGTAQRSVTVAEDESGLGPPPVVGQDPPRDLDGDGLYRDVNGDGQFTVADVQVFFQHRGSDAVQSNPDAFDFRSDGQLSIADVQLLFQQFLEQS